MTAAVIAIADAVVATLGTASLSRPFVAERAYVPVHELKDLARLRVSVVPAELAAATLDRSRHSFDYVIHVGVQQRLDGTTPRHVDPLMIFTQEVVDLFRGQALATDSHGLARCVAVANAPIFAPDHLDEKRVFTSVVSLTFRLVR